MGLPVSDGPDDLFQRHAEAKLRQHGRLLVALGVAQPEPDDEPDDGESGDDREPHAPGF